MGCSINFGIRSAQKEVLTFWLSFAFCVFCKPCQSHSPLCSFLHLQSSSLRNENSPQPNLPPSMRIILSSPCFYVFGHLLDDFSFEQFAICMFVAFDSVCSPCSPLFKEEACTFFFCLSSNVKSP